MEEVHCQVCGQFSVSSLAGDSLCLDCNQAMDVAFSHSLPCVSISQMKLDPKVVALIPTKVATQLKVIAVNQHESTLVVAMAEPSKLAIDELQSLVDLRVEPVVASNASIQAALQASLSIS
jgi:type IV pilus assembly protein PilB